MRRSYLFIVLIGMAVRFAFLHLAGDLEPHADESAYIYLALLLERFGIYSDCGLWLWPPGYAYYLSIALCLFEDSPLLAAKVGQVLASGAIGLSVICLADHWINRRAATIAGAIWCVHLPLIGFSHYLWPETLFLALFLPGFLLYVRWFDAPSQGRGDVRILLSALLIAASLLFKELALYLIPLFAIGAFLRARAMGLSGIRYSAIFALAVACVLTPWTARNMEVYGRFAPAGATLGKNVQMGLKGRYRNLDYPPAMREPLAKANRTVHDMLIGKRPPRSRESKAGNVIDRAAEDARLGMETLMSNPEFAMRFRVKSAADLVSPTSFFVRHYGLDRYRGFLDQPVVRRLLIAIAMASTMLILAGAMPGLALIDSTHLSRWLLYFLMLYMFVSTLPISAMSRYRTPFEPLLIVLAAGFLARPSAIRSFGLPARVVVGGGLALLFTLWGINFREIVAFVRLLA